MTFEDKHGIMIIYQTSKGEGYNPLYWLFHLLGINLALIQTSRKNRKTAYLNSAFFMFVLCISASYLFNVMAFNRLQLFLTPTIYFFWCAAFFILSGKDVINYPFTVGAYKYSYCIFTLEWIVFHFSSGIFFFVLKEEVSILFLKIFFTVLSAAMLFLMFMPLVEASWDKMNKAERC